MTPPRWRRVFRLQSRDPRDDVTEEFAFHLEERIAGLVARGVPEDAAREQALRQFGDLAAATAACSDIGLRRARRARWSERIRSISRDFAYATRSIRRSPGFSAAALATIALGIGANTIVFSLLNALLIQPLDAARPGELVRVYTSQSHAIREERDRFGTSSWADYLNLREARSLAGLAAYIPVGVSVQLASAPPRIQARAVSGNYFTLLGRPLLRGGWQPDVSGTQVVVSHRFWTTALGRDSSAIGDPLMVNGIRTRIVGIAPERFKGIEPTNVDLYFPFQAAPQLTGRSEMLTDRGERSVKLLGRLAPNVTSRFAEQELNGIMSALGAEFPASNAGRVVAVREARSIVPLELTGDGLIPTAVLVFGATLVMLAISGVNVAGLLMARTISRRRELAVRLSLGATRARLIRQLVTESTVLALGAGIVVIALVSLLPLAAASIGVPASVQPTVDSTVLLYAIAVAIGFGIVFGVGPALTGMRSDILESLRSGSGVDTRPAKARAQRGLVSAQIALSTILLLVSGALLESLDRQQRVEPGFEVDRLIVADFEDPLARPSVERERAFVALAVQRLGALDGVVSVTVGTDAPLTSDGMSSTIHIPGYIARPDEDMELPVVITGPDFFRTLGVPMLRGRELTWEHRDTLSYVVINQAMARRYWGDRDPVGTFVELGGRGGRPAEVIGVSSDVRFRSLAEPPEPMYAIQSAGGISHSVMIRTRGDPSALLLAVRGSMSRNDVPFTLAGLRTMEDILRTSLVVSRAVSQTIAVMGMLAILLAAVGLYGVVSYVMTGRTREFGVRLALGATPAIIMRLVLGYGLRLAAIGGIVGLVLGFGALRLVERLLFGSSNVVSLGAVFSVALGAVTLVACALPAMRATRTSPASALRSE